MNGLKTVFAATSSGGEMNEEQFFTPINVLVLPTVLLRLPESIQVLIRTQEITMPDEDETEAEAAAEVQTTFWGRVAQMFKDFWAAITGLFGGKD